MTSTSLRALESLESTGRRQSRTAQVLDLLTSRGWATIGIVDRDLGRKASNRLYDLRNKDLAHVSGETTCPATGMVVDLWRPGPAPAPTPEDLDAEAQRLEAKIRKLSQDLAEVRREANRRRVGQGVLW